MTTHRLLTLIAAILWLGSVSLAQAQSSPSNPASLQPMSRETRMLVIRSLNAEYVFVQRPLPQGTKGIVLKDGKIVSPAPDEWERLVATFGPAAKPGDRAQITNLEFKGDKIVFEINGGPKKKTKWYQRIQISGMGGAAQAPVPDDNTKNPYGALVELHFDKFVPEMTGDKVRDLLSPVFNFHAKSAVEAYLETIPPKAKAAIQSHQVLVGMNREMVTYAKGRPLKKIREQDEQKQDYEEWLYGQPPQEVQFVRFVGDEVVQLKIMKVDGEKIVRTEREVELPKLAEQKAEPKPATPANKPTLKRPGEENQ